MKRVHNDPGQPKSNASVSPPPTGPSKNKKRKAVEVLEPEISEKAAKIAVAIAPVVVKQQPQEPSLIEHYEKQHRMFMDLARQMADPRRSGNDKLYRDAFICIKVMTQTHRRIQAAPAVDAQSG